MPRKSEILLVYVNLWAHLGGIHGHEDYMQTSNKDELALTKNFKQNVFKDF